MEEMREAKFHNPYPMAQQPPLGQGLHIIDAARSHSDTQQPVGLLWTRDQPHAHTSTCQHTTVTTDTHTWLRRDSNTQSQQTYAIDRGATGIGSQLNLMLHVINLDIIAIKTILR